jgi:hypothetical protein
MVIPMIGIIQLIRVAVPHEEYLTFFVILYIVYRNRELVNRDNTNGITKSNHLKHFLTLLKVILEVKHVVFY